MKKHLEYLNEAKSKSTMSSEEFKKWAKEEHGEYSDDLIERMLKKKKVGNLEELLKKQSLGSIKKLLERIAEAEFIGRAHSNEPPF